MAVHDLLHYKGLVIEQTPDTFHFSLDSLLLAYFAPILPSTSKIVDLCSGNAPIPLFLSLRTKAHITAVELQSEAARNAKTSVKMNQLENQITVIEKDLRGVYQSIGHDDFDLVTVNPPYYSTHPTSVVSKNSSQALARHELSLTLKDVFTEASKLLKNKGHLCIIQRSERLQDLLHLCEDTKLMAKSIRFVHPFVNQPANVVILTAKKGAKPGPIEILPPVITHHEDGSYTSQINDLYHYGS